MILSRYLIIILLLGGCATTHERPPPALAPVNTTGKGAFDAKLVALSRDLGIPGMAYAVVRSGGVVASGEFGTHGDEAFTLETPLRFASVSKTLAATLLMQAVERDRLSLDALASDHVLGLPEDVSITLRHLAAHVSEAVPGSEYVYATNRYALLEAPILDAFNGRTYENELRHRIIEPAGMRWYDSPHLGAHAGLVSTVADMARFVAALQKNELISRQAFFQMTTPYAGSAGRRYPVGVGWFAQRIGDARVAWSFGQDEPEHSSALLVMVPDRDIALVLLANTDELSNPFRLLMGDLRYSPFATAFFDAFVPAVGDGIGEAQRFAAEALGAAWADKPATAEDRFGRIVSGHPEAFDPDDLVLHFLATAARNDMWRETVMRFDDEVVSRHPDNRWALLIAASYRERIGDSVVAERHYRKILDLPNQQEDFLRTLFEAWSWRGLAQLAMQADPASAREYLQNGLATGVSGQTRDDLQELLDEMGTSEDSQPRQ